MKYAILDFNQEKILEYDLDITDILILDYIIKSNGTPTMQHITKDDVSYVWLSHDRLLEDLPIIHISEGTLKNRLVELKKKGLITSITDSSSTGRGSKTFYSITELTTSLQNDSVSRPRHSGVTSDINILSKDNINTNISKDILGGVEDKAYSSSDFLGSSRAKKSSKRNTKSLYSKCVDEIDHFTNSLELRTILITYLSFRLSVKDKPIYGVAQWKGLLNKLKDVSISTNTDMRELVQQSLDKGWLSFYPIKTFNNKDVFAEGDGISCEQSSVSLDERKKLSGGF